MKQTNTRDGRAFAVWSEHDDDATAPWEREDGHGPVSDWRRLYNPATGCRDKAPGEIKIHHDGRGAHGSVRYYDFAEATRIAKRDGWGLSEAATAKLAGLLGRKPTRKEIVREAVLRDMERLRAWCADRWNYVGVCVQEIDAEGDQTGEVQSLWGIESDSADYLDEVAQELAAQLIHDNPEPPATLAQLREAVEAAQAAMANVHSLMARL